MARQTAVSWLLYGLAVTHIWKDCTCIAVDIFEFQENGLYTDGEPPRIPFDKNWLNYNRHLLEPPVPNELVAPKFLQVYRLRGDATDLNAQDVVQSIQAIVDRDFADQHEAVLFRGLPWDAKAFETFWSLVTWPHYRRIDPFYDRRTLQGIHLAPAAYPELLVNVHNEQTYNPTSPNKVLFYCLQHAVRGGESLLVRNHELTDRLDPWVAEFLQEQGNGTLMYDQWILFDRTRTDDPDKHAKSWQHKAGTDDLEEALRVFENYGFERSLMNMDDEGTLFMRNFHPNIYRDGDRNLWLSSISLQAAKLPNGERLPFEFYQKIEVAEWQSTYAFTLQKGDLIVLDNWRVAHGRLSYENGPHQQRELMTTYAL